VTICINIIIASTIINISITVITKFELELLSY